ncbi:MAG TPA: hypothetical protein VH722_00965 [Alphaproteobacteria bacterium]|jgi:hypothetical protein|nr:hypothetical protein [Alphaproteobacteria bacterium]
MFAHDLFFYHPETIWVLIPLVVIIGGFITKWHSTNVKLDLARTGNGEVMQDVLDCLRRLEHRVENLERAAMTAETERKYYAL